MEALSALIVLVALFLFIWPLLIWSHLREQTKSLKAIAKLLSADR